MIKIDKFINNQCMAFMICFNWNYVYSIEIAFLFWKIEFQFGKTKKWRF